MLSTPQLLNDADFCARLPILGQKWEKESLTPMQLLARGIDHGLNCESDDPGQSSGDRVMTLAVSRPIDTPQSDLLGLAEHTAALADMITWLLRTGPSWQRPAALKVGTHLWQPDSFLGPHGLRRVVLVDRWSDERAEAERFDWRSLEGVIYAMPMTLVVVVLGASRDGRRHGPLSKGWIHPQAGDLRFRKRNGSGFGENWKPVFRESFGGDREEWLEALSEDRVLEESLILHEVAFPEHSDKILALANSRLKGLADSEELPEPQLSRCHDPIRKCPFVSCCPHFRMPSGKSGFIRSA